MLAAIAKELMASSVEPPRSARAASSSVESRLPPGPMMSKGASHRAQSQEHMNGMGWGLCLINARFVVGDVAACAKHLDCDFWGSIVRFIEGPPLLLTPEVRQLRGLDNMSETASPGVCPSLPTGAGLRRLSLLRKFLRSLFRTSMSDGESAVLEYFGILG